jgi:hypothetical protein
MSASDTMARPKKSETRILNVFPSKNPEKNWGMAEARQAGLIKTSPNLPAVMDLRRGRRWWRIKDQGQTGSCVGHGVAYGLLWYHKPSVLPSARFTWMGSKETDAYVKYPTSFCEMSGTYIEGALKFSKKYGSIPDKMLSMRAHTTKKSEAVIYGKAAGERIKSYHRLSNPKEWREWIATNGPLVLQLQPDPQFYGARTKVLDNYVKQRRGAGAHCVVLCGYGPGLFIVRNSWGTGWGHRGYCYVTESYAKDSFSEVFGITV